MQRAARCVLMTRCRLPGATSRATLAGPNRRLGGTRGGPAVCGRNAALCLQRPEVPVRGHGRAPGRRNVSLLFRTTPPPDGSVHVAGAVAVVALVLSPILLAQPLSPTLRRLNCGMFHFLLLPRGRSRPRRRRRRSGASSAGRADRTVCRRQGSVRKAGRRAGRQPRQLASLRRWHGRSKSWRGRPKNSWISARRHASCLQQQE